MKRPTIALTAVLAVLPMALPGAQQPPAQQTAQQQDVQQTEAESGEQQPEPEPEPFAADGIPPVPLPEEPVVYDTARRQRIRVSVVTAGLTYPWGFAFLPDGSVLVTERLGALRRIHDGVLDPTPIAGVPEVSLAGQLEGLMDVAVHPDFAQNRLVYLTYSKPTATGSTVALARGRFEGAALSEVRDVFVADAEMNGGASRLAFATDGTLYMTVGGAFGGRRPLAQDPASHVGKVLRLRDDGTAPDDNPFIGQDGAQPEVFSLGHRNPMGIAIHPETGAVWASEHAPMGGDEVNLIRPGRNYGWPVVSYSREYYGPRVTERPWQENMEQPEIVWIPSIAPSGLVFYSGDRFPAWRSDLFAGSLMTGRIDRTGHLERIELNRQGMEERREWLLADLRQRIRDVDQGPDGLLYVLTGGSFLGRDPERGAAALLRIEPVD
ncbi:MAG: PQQ-dependent sugar dehydrogenase [Acidobacteria bacterium]|nr:PQQ-dependent sugar dehydrogenase [Acidobacteriota bacterium]